MSCVLLRHLPARTLQEPAKLFDREARIANDPAHGEGVHRVVARNREDARVVRHDDVLALTRDTEAGLLKGSHGIEMVDAGELGHGSRDFDFADFGAA